MVSFRLVLKQDVGAEDDLMLPGMGQKGEKSDLGQFAALHLPGLIPPHSPRTGISSHPFMAGGGGVGGGQGVISAPWMSVSEPYAQVALLCGLDPLGRYIWAQRIVSLPSSFHASGPSGCAEACTCHGRRPALGLIATRQQQEMRHEPRRGVYRRASATSQVTGL